MGYLDLLYFKNTSLVSLLNLDNAAVFQCQDTVSAVENAVIMGDEQSRGAPCFTHAFQQIDDLGRTVLVQCGGDRQAFPL